MNEETAENKEKYDQICNDYDEIEMNTFLQGRMGNIIMQATFKDK